MTFATMSSKQMVKTDQMQVEETLNNSNDLFLTFRKEMEEMSKKTKRLEKENQSLQRTKEVTNRNIAEMVEERTKMQDEINRKTKEVEDQRKKVARLETLCRGMQAQGRGQVPMAGLDDDEMTESEYDYEDEDDEGSAEYDDDTEDDGLEAVQERRPFGPVPPPPPQPHANVKVNGHRQVNGQVNGARR
jgi:predicted RNase H-like nuclease (RuvC/YqgF family)